MAKDLKKRKRKLFSKVDVFQTHFGQISVTAIYDVFMQEFGIEKSKMKNFSFSHCVEALRKLENPEYKKGDMSLTKEIEVVEPIFVEHDVALDEDLEMVAFIIDND
jgi:hypothetical protein